MDSEGQGREKACPTCGTRYPADALFCSIDGAPLSTARPGAFAANAATDPYLGREILGHIEIRQLVGIGAMGRVYRAFQRGIERDVAVKILHRELSANPTLVARFHREAKVASRLAHPHVVHVLLVGQLPDGAMYIVMEFLDGMSLQSALAAVGGAMPLPRVLHVALALCDAAGEAHAQGVVHRDFKPENVMLVKRADDPDFVKVLDFGIARLHWDEHSMATAAGLIFGTARYISPEGARGEKVGPQGDVYSIVTMVYQMLSGRTPFDADQAVLLLVQQIHDPPTSLKGIARASYVPDPIAAVVMANLAKNPDERAPDARALGRAFLDAALKSGLSAHDILAPPSLSGRGGGAHASVVQMPSMQRTGKLQVEAPVAAVAVVAAITERPPSTTTAGVTSPGTRPPTRPPMHTEVPDPASLPPGSVSTTRWVPPADFESRIQAGPPSGVDTTIDDRAPTFHTAPPLQRTPPPPSSPGDAVPMHALHGRRVLLIAACFLVGATLTAGAWRAGWVGERSSPRAPTVARVSEGAGPAAPRSPAELVAETPAPSASVPAVPPLSNAHAVAGAGSWAGGARAVLDASSVKPGVGQPVDFVAHVTGAARPKVEGARFRFVGPGITGGTEVAAVDDGLNGFHTTFTFLEGGHFDVTFNARADGAPIRVARVVQVAQAGGTAGETPEPPPPPPNAAAPSPPPGDTSKWL